MSVGEFRLARVAGLSGLAVAVWFPIFGLAFALLSPATGFDLTRLGEPEYALPQLRERAWLIRFLAVGNGASMLAGAVFASCVSVLSWRATPHLAVLGGSLAVIGWLIYLAGEASDQAAYLFLPFTQLHAPEEANAAFVALQSLGRVAHAWGYCAIGSGTLALALAVRSLPWAGRACAWGVAAASASLLLFAFELVVTPSSGDAGGGFFWAFGLLLAGFGSTQIAWHGVAGLALLKRSASRAVA